MPTLIQKHCDEWETCTRCPLARTRHKTALYRGTTRRAKLLFIGEAPGKTEDTLGEPFVGRSGRLLNHWLVQSEEYLGRPLPSYCITNTIACIPWSDDSLRDTREPAQSEIDACNPRLTEFIKIVRPTAVIALGRHAQKALSPEMWSGLRLDLFHPSYHLRSGGHRSPSFKRDLLTFCKFLEEHKL